MIEKTSTPPSLLKSVFIPALIGAFVGSLSIGFALAGVALWISITLCIFGAACIFFSYLYVRKAFWPHILIWAGLGVLLATPAIAVSLILKLVANILSYFGHLLASKYLEELLSAFTPQSVTEIDYFVAGVGVLLIVIGVISQLVLTKISSAPTVHWSIADEGKQNTFEEYKNVWSSFVASDEFTTWKMYASMAWSPPINGINSENAFLDEIHPETLKTLDDKAMNNWKSAPQVKAKIDEYFHLWEEYYNISVKYSELTFPLTKYAGLNILTGGFSSFADGVKEYVANRSSKPSTKESKDRDKDVFNRIAVICQKYQVQTIGELRGVERYKLDIANTKMEIETTYNSLIGKWSEVLQAINANNVKYGVSHQ